MLLCVLLPLQQFLEQFFLSPEGIAAEDGYETESVAAQVAERFASTRNAGGSTPPRSSTSFATPTSAASLAKHIHNPQLATIQAELANLSQSMRKIADHLVGGSRAKAKESMQLLQNTPAGDSESGSYFSAAWRSGRAGAVPTTWRGIDTRWAQY